MEQEQDIRPFSDRKKVDFLKQAKSQATDERPVWVNLKKPESLPWVGIGELPPQKGTFIDVIQEPQGRRKVPVAIVVDFTRLLPIPEFPYARLPLDAVEITEKGEIWVNCPKAVAIGIAHSLPNFFVPRFSRD